MFNITRVPRIMSGTDIGSWLETVPDTLYRNNHNWLLCRARGKGNGGRITGQRFYIIARDGMGRPHKVRSKTGSIRYYDTPHAAATAAVQYGRDMVKSWERMKLVSEAEGLTLQIKSLNQERDHLIQTVSELQSYVNRLNGSKSVTAQAVKAASTALDKLRKATSTEEAERKSLQEQEKQLPSFMYRSALAISRLGRLH